MGKAIWKSSTGTRLGKSFKLRMFIRTPWKRVVLICVCGWHQIDWKETKHWSDVGSTKQRSCFGRTNIFPWSCIPGCTQRQCETSKDIVDNYRTMFESRISAGATEKLPCSENLCISAWSDDMEGHAKKCVERYCELANKTTQQLYKVSTPCIDDHHFKEEEMKSVGELPQVCSQIVLKCLYLATNWTTRYSMVSK